MASSAVFTTWPVMDIALAGTPNKIASLKERLPSRGNFVSKGLRPPVKSNLGAFPALKSSTPDINLFRFFHSIVFGLPDTILGPPPLRTTIASAEAIESIPTLFQGYSINRHRPLETNPILKVHRSNTPEIIGQRDFVFRCQKISNRDNPMGKRKSGSNLLRKYVVKIASPPKFKN